MSVQEVDGQRHLDAEDVVPSLEHGPVAPDVARSVAARLVGWADDADLVLEGGLTPASLLVMAAEQLSRAQLHQERLELVDRSIVLGDDTGIDLRIYRVGALVDADRHDEALALSDEIRRARPRAPLHAIYLGDVLESAGHLPQAERWYSIALRHLDAGDEEREDPDWDVLLLGRRRLRRAQGKAADAWDVDADAVEALLADGWGDEDR